MFEMISEFVVAGLLVALAVAMVGAGVALVVCWFRRVMADRAWRREYGPKMEKFRRASELRKDKWIEAVKLAACLLRGDDWTSLDPKSITQFVEQLYGSGVPDYLWYENPGDLSEEEVRAITGIFWPDGVLSFGDFEFHGRMFRIRDAKVFRPEVVLSGRKPLSLCQIGYSYFGEIEPGCVSLPQLKPRKEAVAQ